MSPDTITIAATIFVSVYGVVFFAYFLFRKYLQHAELLSERENDRLMKMQNNADAQLDLFRAHLERNLMDMNEKFSSSDSRWRELYHLVVEGQKNNSEEKSKSMALVKSSDFLQSHGIYGDKLKIKKSLIFVLTPFHNDMADEFNVVMSAGKEMGFTVLRGDEKKTKGDIFPHLLEMLVSANIVVANITGRNPNVFYELGIAHALDKPVILLSQNYRDVPFDLQSKQIVFYRDNSDLQINLRLNLPEQSLLLVQLILEWYL